MGVLVGVLALGSCVFSGCGGQTAHELAVSSRAVLAARPLKLPSVQPGSRCPVSRVQHLAWSFWDLVGNGPVLLSDVQHATGAHVDIDDYPPLPGGWLGQKAPWYVRDSYRGPLLIRGRQLDGTSPLRFDGIVHGHHPSALWWGAVDYIPQNHSHGYWGLASAVLFRKVGCYGFQLDGTSFSEHIVVEAIL